MYEREFVKILVQYFFQHSSMWLDEWSDRDLLNILPPLRLAVDSLMLNTLSFTSLIALCLSC